MPRSKTLSRSRGYSLVELIVVVAIIGIMALVVGPWFTKVSQRNTVKSAARELSTTLAAARMRAVKRNLPAEVVVTRVSGSQSYNRVETFEMVPPTPLKVGELEIPPTVDFPTAGNYYMQPAGGVMAFGPDGRSTTPGVFTIRGAVGSGLQNDLPVSVSGSGKITVFGPNPTALKPQGTEWK